MNDPSSPAGDGTAAWPATLENAQWAPAIEQFCQATGLTACIYDASGKRVAGPLYCTPLSALLVGAGLWSPAGPADRAEAELVQEVLHTREPLSRQLYGSLRVDALPLLVGARPVGAVLYGWVFDHFSDPVECERLGRALGIAGHTLWSTSRLQQPTSASRFEVAGTLLKTLATQNLNQLSALSAMRELARMRDEFLLGVSHELRTPLQSLRLRIDQLLRTQLDDPENIRRLLLAMKRSVDAEAKLVEDLLEASQTLSGKLTVELEPLRLAAMVAEAIEASEPAAHAKGITLTSSIPPAFHGEVLGDASRLRQVLWNLLINALKFTPEGGRVTLRVSESPAGVELAVSDTGIGIPREVLGQIFEPFAQGSLTRSQRKGGLGLGLAIARHVVELHGGTISVASEGPGTGATFTVRLPVRARAGAAWRAP
ncbi:HAMP domain-containing histidine kinase [Aggregicoccus sp. 17bor-14]|uniref:sensor histidine kinase n=1 Tax=Myxococcaceae TaxID=31 RepID=UPI00129C2197|nr:MULTISPECIES: HAMP domain-containing sensor histidine kinase [Myxococcaceae]MBF5043751.1 HAMP domain-containing histidine kinase [Simulacricoccus sp. 17bor-14]MRI89506.1 HAMP domain-containing histidine kinase [Aggregicoccus sp. 17bor-14]